VNLWFDYGVDGCSFVAVFAARMAAERPNRLTGQRLCFAIAARVALWRVPLGLPELPLVKVPSALRPVLRSDMPNLQL